MATTVSVKSLTRLQNSWLVTGSIALSGSYTTHGDTLSFVNASLPISTNVVPSLVLIDEMPNAGITASGYWFNFALGSSLANGAMQVFQGASGASAPAAELAAGAYPAALTSAKIYFQAFIPAL